MSNYDQEDYYPTDKIYEILGKNTSSTLEDFLWYGDLKACLDMMKEKLGSARLTNLHELWSSGFEDLELKKLERSLLTVQIVLDDIKREGKELRVWKVQYRHLKDLLCEAGDILDDIALRAPHLKQLFQSPQVTPHPYLTDKLLQINNLIRELNNLAAEIKSMVLPEFNTRRRKTPGPKIDSNVPSAMSSHEPPGRNIHSNLPLAISSYEPMRPYLIGGKNNHHAATPGAHDISMYYAFTNPQGNVSNRRNEVPAKTNEEIIPHSYDSTTESKDLRKNHDTGSTESGENRGTESVEPRKNWDTDSMDRGKSRVTDSVEPRKNWDTDSMDRGKSRVTDSMDRGKSRVTDSIHVLEEPLISYGPKTTTSIDDLPKHLQKCLLYVSLFPRNYNFEKEIVVQMWIAVGYIKSEGKKLMEETAGGYLDEMLSMSLFEVSPLDESSYILPDDAYNMIQESAGAEAEAEYARLEDGNLNGISRRTLHSSVLYESTVDPMVFKSFNKLKGLHSLLLLHENRRYITKIPYDLMLSLRCIRVLDLSGTQLTELPSSVGDMKTLHYLDLSGTRVRSLPGSISGLSSLQVLRLRDCLDFVELPKNMKNIINLRHLDLDIIRQLTFMPPRMGRLTKLQTLSAFIARKERGFQIAELKKMINLRGSLSIVKLENVGPLEEAEEAALCDKEYLHKLVFQWSMPCLNAEEVLQGLEPNQNLTDLEIICYGGSTFPAWLGDSTFSKLSNIHIYNCKNGIILPFLGRLPSLKTLRIAEMHTLDGIDDQFSRGSSSTGFPKLETLEFDGMHAWKEWTGLAEEEMPRLHTLTIADCPNLVSLPGLSNLKSLQHLEISSCFKLLSLAEERLPTSLQTLIITDCPHLKEVYQKEAVDWHKIEDVPNVWIDYQHIC